MVVLAYTAAFLWAFWGIYVLVMGLYRAHLARRLTPLTYLMAAPFLLIGYAIDVIANMTIASVFFVELPREVLVTSRLQRHVKTSTDWRCSLARAVCDRLLDVFDPSGDHC